MPSLKSLTSVSRKPAYALFEIRLDSDFLVFRGSTHESAGQLLRGTVVACLPHSLRVDYVHLRLTGTLHYACPEITSNVFLEHRWEPFVKNTVLKAGNYEWPFETLLPGDTRESVEGLNDATVRYRLKATMAPRGKLSTSVHAFKRLRIVRTLEPSALELLHAMNIDSTWPNKLDYSIVVPQKAVALGTHVALETRFTPLAKNLNLEGLHVKLIETHEFSNPLPARKREREAAEWKLPINREQHWHDVIDETGQEGWVMNTKLALPKRLGRCVQDCHTQGIKIRHRLRLIVALRNSDGHSSELRANLPVTVFISPHMPMDEDGNVVPEALHPDRRSSEAAEADAAPDAPPGYGEHVLDRLYLDIDNHHHDYPLYQGGSGGSLDSPGSASAIQGPQCGLSRASSSENLATHDYVSRALHMAVHPAALSSRVMNRSLDDTPARIRQSVMSSRPNSGTATPSMPFPQQQTSTEPSSPPVTTTTMRTLPPPPRSFSDNFSRQNSFGARGRNPISRHGTFMSTGAASSRPDDGTDIRSLQSSYALDRRNRNTNNMTINVAATAVLGGCSTATRSPHATLAVDDVAELSKVPSYQTAVRTPLRPFFQSGARALPDYDTATSAPTTPAFIGSPMEEDSLPRISETGSSLSALISPPVTTADRLFLRERGRVERQGTMMSPPICRPPLRR